MKKELGQLLSMSPTGFETWVSTNVVEAALDTFAASDALSGFISQVLAISASASSAALKVRSIVASSCSTELNAASNWLQGR